MFVFGPWLFKTSGCEGRSDVLFCVCLPSAAVFDKTDVNEPVCLWKPRLD